MQYKKCNHNGGCDDFWLNCNIGCKKHAADHIKNFWLCTWLPLLVFTKRCCGFVFDLISVVLWLLLAVHFISELTKFELIITILSIIMSI